MALNPETQHPDGKWKKGGPSPNPSGGPSRKNFMGLLDKLFTDETISFILFSKLFGLNTNTTDCKNIIKLIDQPEVKTKFRKYLSKLKVNGKLNYKTGWNKLNEAETFFFPDLNKSIL